MGVAESVITLILPYPPKLLNPNQPGGWKAKASTRKKYRNDCWALARSEPRPSLPEGDIPLRFTFHAPSRNYPDSDNALSAFKNGLDGVCLAWGIDDNRFNPITIIRGYAMQPGQVVIEV